MKRSPLKRSTKPIPKVNARRQAKRKAGYRKLLSGKEYRAARAEAFKRADRQCEQEGIMTLHWSEERGCHEKPSRCQQSTELHAHHLRYPKSRPLTASDLKILCKYHHEMAEAAKMHKTRMF